MDSQRSARILQAHLVGRVRGRRARHVDNDLLPSASAVARVRSVCQHIERHLTIITRHVCTHASDLEMNLSLSKPVDEMRL